MQSPLCVIVVGGSIAGLTLAHCLDHAGIEYLVLEKHHNIGETCIGGPVGVQPNGARILAQLGLSTAISKVGEPVTTIHVGYPGEFDTVDDWPISLKGAYFIRLGFPISLFRRQDLVCLLYGALRNQSKVHFNKRVVRISQTDSGVDVMTHDKNVYHADIAVGADGVHSVTRSEARRIASSTGQLARPLHLTTKYSAVVGMSAGVPGIYAGDQMIRLCNASSILLSGGREGKYVGWVVEQTLPQQYTYPDIPCFTQDDAIQSCQRFLEMRICRDIKFRDIWERRETCAMVPLEEGLLPDWHYGRIVCIGDSVNKMTPNFGQGANTAIEHAAALANALHRLSRLSVQAQATPSTQEISNTLETVRKKLFPHIYKINTTSWLTPRLQTQPNWALDFVGRYLLPHLLPYMVYFLALLFADSVVLDFLPLPAPVKSGSKQAAWTVSVRARNWRYWRLKLVGPIIVIFGVSFWLGLGLWTY